jgi:hypothetical protein
MPIRSGAMQRPNGFRCGNTLRQRYDEVGLPCNSTMGSPCPTSTYAISRPRTRRRCFWYGNAAEIMFAMFASPLVVATKNVFEQHRRRPANFCRFFLKERSAWRLDRYCCRSFTVATVSLLDKRKKPLASILRGFFFRLNTASATTRCFA